MKIPFCRVSCEGNETAYVREVLNVIEWLEAGAHIVTVVPDILKGMIIHPYSKETVQMFLDDAKKADLLLDKSR